MPKQKDRTEEYLDWLSSQDVTSRIGLEACAMIALRPGASIFDLTAAAYRAGYADAIREAQAKAISTLRDHESEPVVNESTGEGAAA